MSNLNGGLSGSGLLRGALGGGGAPSQDVYWDDILNKPEFAEVATSGSYNDLTDKPTIPAAQVNADWNATSGVAEILNKPTIPTTASQISYDNTTSGLTATDTQEAIDENAAEITTIKSNLSQLDGLIIYKDLTPTDDYAEFNDGSNLPLISLISTIEPVQSGSGDPSPTNVRPISGFTEANVVVSPTTDAEDGTTYNVQFKDGDNPLTVYGGTLDVVSGELVVTHGYIDMGSLDWGGTPSNYAFTSLNPTKANGVTNVIADCYETIDVASVSSMTNGSIKGNGGTSNVYVKDERFTTASDLKTALSGHYLCYELKTPQTYQLTPTQVSSLLGQNYISSDVGDITNVKYLGIVNLS